MGGTETDHQHLLTPHSISSVTCHCLVPFEFFLFLFHNRPSPPESTTNTSQTMCRQSLDRDDFPSLFESATTRSTMFRQQFKTHIFKGVFYNFRSEKRMFLYSAVSSLLDRSKRFTLSSPGRPVHSDTNSASPGNILARQQLRND